MKNNGTVIFGDSYSTFLGSIPDGYAVYYSGNRVAEPDIRSAEYSWWGLLCKETGAELIRNDSWSGSTIGYTGYNNTDTSETSSFIYRLNKLADEGFFEKNEISRVFVFGGTNDSWSGAPLGCEMQSGWQKEDLYKVLPAIGYFFSRLRSLLPDAQIYGICNCDIKGEIVEAIKNACEQNRASAVVLKGIDKISGHPTELGMMQIKDQVSAALDLQG